MSGWSPTPTPKLPMASKSAKSSWPMPAVRCMMATRSRPYSPMNSPDRYADGNQYLGMVDPQPASVGRLFDHPSGSRLAELHQARGDPPTLGRHPRDLGCG